MFISLPVTPCLVSELGEAPWKDHDFPFSLILERISFSFSFQVCTSRKRTRYSECCSNRTACKKCVKSSNEQDSILKAKKQQKSKQ